jgi:outer membrane protein assembly factor BamA
LPGDVVNFKKLKEGLDKVRRLYEVFGFINWSYVPEQTFDEQNKTMTLSFSIDEGLQYFIAYVAFVGCRDQAEEERLKTQTFAQPGHPFNLALIDNDTLRLKQTLGVAVKASMEILPEKGLVGIVYWLNTTTTN